MNLKSLSIISFVCVLIGTPALAASGKIYKWTDSKGQTHYTQRPPMNTQTEVIKTQTGSSDPVSTTQAAAKPEAKVEEQVSAPAKDKERCAIARKQADILKTYARVREKTESGELRYITPEEHAQKLGEANKAIEESCE